MIINQELLDKTFKILKDRASRHDPIYYGELYKMLDLDHSNPKDRVLGSNLLAKTNEISGKDYMITSFVVGKGENGPFVGFYTLAEQYGRIEPGLTDRQKDEFWVEEMRRVHEKYRKV